MVVMELVHGNLSPPFLHSLTCLAVIVTCWTSAKKQSNLPTNMSTIKRPKTSYVGTGFVLRPRFQLSTNLLNCLLILGSLDHDIQ